jgi:hypothetical protein
VRVDGELIVERLDGETLVYDTATSEAHRLDAAASARFDAAPNDVSRRQVLRKLAVVGAAAAGAGPLIKTIAVPTPAQAQSVCAPPCGPNQFCNGGNCLDCGAQNQLCCPGDVCNTGLQCQNSLICLPPCGPGDPCCPGNTCNQITLVCVAGTCQFCGGAGGPCCTQITPCTNGVCVNGTCQCGAAGQPCCQPGNVCNAGLDCDAGVTNTCIASSDRALKRDVATVEPRDVLGAVG